MYPLNIARRHNKDIIVFPQSASTINRLGQRILSPILTKSALLMLREKDSFDYLSSLMPPKNFYQTIDLAFFIDKANLPSPLVKEQHSIGITLRFHTVGDISYLPEDLIKEYLSELGEAVEELKNTHNVVIIVQCDKDYEKSMSFAAKHQIQIKKTNNVLELLATYKKMDLLIGMRLHSIILALSVGTPCFGLFCKQWGLKNPGMMKTFDMPYRFCDDHLNSEDILSAIRPLLDNRKVKSDHILQLIEQEKSNIVGEMRLVMTPIATLHNGDSPVTHQR
jgi:polysaccharide pyruvyl transferase WcaK-like protein